TRLADPYGRHPWPTRTTVILLEPQITPGRTLLLAKGEPFTVKFAVRGVLPPTATVSVRLAGAGPADDAVPVEVADGANEAVVEHRLDAGRVPRDFEFRVTANDADTGWFPVTVAPPPR